MFCMARLRPRNQPQHKEFIFGELRRKRASISAEYTCYEYRWLYSMGYLEYNDACTCNLEKLIASDGAGPTMATMSS